MCKFHILANLLLFILLSRHTNGYHQDQRKLSSKQNHEKLINNYQMIQIHIEETSQTEKHSEQNGKHFERIKRKAPSTHVSFTAYNESYSVELTPIDESKRSVISPTVNISLVSNHGIKPISLDTLDIHYYEGIVDGYESSVHGWIQAGSFTGALHIHGDNGTLFSMFIQPASRFFNDLHDEDLDFSVVYKDTDIRNFNISNRAEQTFQVKDSDSNKMSVTRSPRRNMVIASKKDSHHRRSERSTQVGMICDLHVVIDHTFYEHIGHSDVATTMGEVLFYIKEADSIYREIDFDMNGQPEGLGFIISELVIYESDLVPGYTLGGEFPDAGEFLDHFSLADFSGECLAPVFVHRDFGDSIVGLAWVAYHNTFLGGVCSPRARVNGGDDLTSLNTLVVSSLNFGHTLPPIVNAITLAHEIGHALSSEHDDPDAEECAGGGSQGHYIMHPNNLNYDKPNNKKFSNCSKHDISFVLEARKWCFQKQYSAVCGNSITEIGEECDCGSEEHCELIDPCCIPSEGSTDDDEIPCTIRKISANPCSPRESACCNEQCEVVGESAKKRCHTSSWCTYDSICDGNSSSCPAQSAVPDWTLCQSGTGVCLSGQCTQDICELYGLSPCDCDDIENACMRCCHGDDNGQNCTPLRDLNLVGHDQSLCYVAPGTQCNHYQGYCDQDNQCIIDDWDSRIKFFIKGLGFDSVANWLNEHWKVIFGILAAAILSVAIQFYRYKKRKRRHQT